MRICTGQQTHCLSRFRQSQSNTIELERIFVFWSRMRTNCFFLEKKYVIMKWTSIWELTIKSFCTLGSHCLEPGWDAKYFRAASRFCHVSIFNHATWVIMRVIRSLIGPSSPIVGSNRISDWNGILGLSDWSKTLSKYQTQFYMAANVTK